MAGPFLTVVETPTYLRDATRVLSENERADLSDKERNALAVFVKTLVKTYGTSGARR